MADHVGAIDRRLGILLGQMHALREHVSDADRSPREVVNLLGQIRGGVDQVAALIAHRYLDECLPDEDELEDHQRIRRDAVRKVIGSAR